MNQAGVVISALLLSGCAGQTPHVLDTGISGAVLASGGAELNPIGFPAVVAVKVIAEGAAEAAYQRGERITCTQIASSTRYGSWIGTGVTVGGLIAGPVGMGVGALIAVFAGEQPAMQSAVETCYRRPSGAAKATTFNNPGWGG